jgi:hypothetical protein
VQSGEDERPGPVPVPGDSWVDAPTGARHRLNPSRRSLRYLWVLAVLAAIAVVPTVALPLLRGGGGDAPDLAAAVATTPATSGAGSGSSTGPGMVLVTAPPGVSATPAPGSGPAGGTRPVASTTSALPPAAPLPLALEAEGAGVSLMRAEVEAIDGASGGRGARFTGTPGRVRYSSLAVATGTYRVTIAYAPGAQASATVQGVDGQVGVIFAAGSGCCATVSAQVPMAAGGTLTIRLNSAGGTYPAIDRVVIEQA